MKQRLVKNMFLTIGFLAVISAQAGIPSEGIVAKFMFTGNTADSSFNHHRAISSEIVLSVDRFGNENRSYRFNGTSSYIVVDSAQGLPSGNTARSISVWFRSATVSSSSLMILAGIGSMTASEGTSFQIGHSSDGWRINGYGDSYDWRTGIAWPDYLDTLWRHCVVTYDGARTHVYFDGALRASTSNYRYMTKANRIIIGKEIDLSGWNFSGNLDDIIIYDRALSESDVKALYLDQSYGIELIDVPSSIERRPRFSWRTAPGASGYTVKIDTTANFANPMILAPVPDTTYTPGADLPIDTIYWKVSSDKNQHSSIGVFIVKDGRIPGIVPIDPNLISTKRPVFFWHPAPGAASYTIVADTTGQFLHPLFTTPVEDTFFQPLFDLPADTIFWKVRSDLTTAFSSVDWFIILSDSIPLLFRFNGAHCIDNQPTFRWKKVEQATGYTIQIDTVRSFAAALITLPLSDTSYMPNIKLRDHVYFWRVSSSRNMSLFSPIDSLVIRSITGNAPKSQETANQFGFRCVFSRKTNMMILRAPFLKHNATLCLYDLLGKKVGDAVVPKADQNGTSAVLSMKLFSPAGFQNGLYIAKINMSGKIMTGLMQSIQ